MIDYSQGLDLSDIKVADIVAYLKANGWSQEVYRDHTTLLFTKPDEESEEPFLVALPYTEKYRDYSGRIEEVLGRVAEADETSLAEILQKIRALHRDVIYVRLQLDGQAYPTLDRAAHFVQGVRDLVSWGACLEVNTQPYFAHRPLHQGPEQARHFQLAHTWQGSFGFAIESQLSESQPTLWGNTIEPQEIPLPRRVLERIARGFRLVQQAVQHQEVGNITEHYNKGFNGNMCEAAQEMLNAIGEETVEFRVQWSLDLAVAGDIAELPPMILRKDVLAYLQKATEILKHQASTSSGLQEQEQELHGLVVNLWDRGKKNITHWIQIDTQAYGPVRMKLNEEQQQQAANAYVQRVNVSVKGPIRKYRDRNQWVLENPHEFTLHLT
jgi:hypothetical protein